MAEVKELKEAILALGESALLVKKIMKDGKLNLDDLQALKETDYSEIMTGIKGIADIKAEVQDISLMEAQEILVLLMAEFKKVQAA